MNILKQLWFFCFVSVLMAGCASSYNQPIEGKQDSVSQNYYTSAYPTRDISNQLRSVQNAVKRISATAIYQTYYLDDKMVTLEELKGIEVKDIATNSITQNESTAGTAFAIARNNRSIVLLTCAHVIDFPDTLVSYYDKNQVPEKTFVKSLTIKRHQTNLLYDLPNIGRFSIMAQNSKDDLALIEVDLEEFNELQVPPLPIRLGNPDRLRLGSVVMIMGYPKGYPMVTRGIVSDPNRSRDGDFLTDALFNQGISGGIILASRNNYGSFEWIGVANTASAEKELTLVPNPVNAESYESFDLYSDSIYVQSKTRITYGITQAIPAARILRFLKDHERRLRRRGLGLDFVLASYD